MEEVFKTRNITGKYPTSYNLNILIPVRWHFFNVFEVVFSKTPPQKHHLYKKRPYGVVHTVVSPVTIQQSIKKKTTPAMSKTS